jgi:hypothetical protein
MKIFALGLFCSLFAFNAFANTQIDAACEKNLVDAAIPLVEGYYPLEYQVNGVVRSDLFNDYIEVAGYYSDADEDYSYTEIYEIAVTKNTCDIQDAELVEVIEN